MPKLNKLQQRALKNFAREYPDEGGYLQLRRRVKETSGQLHFEWKVLTMVIEPDGDIHL